MNDELRKKIKIYKAITGVSYKTIAEYLQIKQSSIYSWISGDFDLSNSKCIKLK